MLSAEDFKLNKEQFFAKVEEAEQKEFKDFKESGDFGLEHIFQFWVAIKPCLVNGIYIEELQEKYEDNGLEFRYEWMKDHNIDYLRIELRIPGY